MLGCERGSGFISPRIKQQLQMHDISLMYYARARHHLQPPVNSNGTSTINASLQQHTSGQHVTIEETAEHIIFGKDEEEAGL